MALVVRNHPEKAGDVRDASLGQEISWKKAWQPTPVFLPGKPHGQRSLPGYSPWGREEPDTMEGLNDDKPFYFSVKKSQSADLKP